MHEISDVPLIGVVVEELGSGFVSQGCCQHNRGTLKQGTMPTHSYAAPLGAHCFIRVNRLNAERSFMLFTLRGAVVCSWPLYTCVVLELLLNESLRLCDSLFNLVCLPLSPKASGWRDIQSTSLLWIPVSDAARPVPAQWPGVSICKSPL